MISGEKMFEDGEKSLLTGYYLLQVINYMQYFQIFWFAACKRIKSLKPKEEEPEMTEGLFYRGRISDYFLAVP